MDFRFNVNNLLPKRINKITHTLIPEGFRGDRREYNECQRLLTRILDDMGEASAKAQGLNRTITSALKLRDTDHVIYLMVDSEGNNGLGSVVGLLKTGSKTLFMFDENGLHYQIKPRCILDFYIHESKQRMGLGNQLYEHMLEEENLKPIKLAIDRPSDKFLAFLKKYYSLESIIPQNNKFVVFKGFFDDEIEERQGNNRYSSTPSPSRPSTEYKNQANSNNDAHSPKNNSINGTPSRSAFGRYAASRPPCSMASIIHNTSGEQLPERTRSRASSRASSAARYEQRPDSLSLYHEEIIPKTQQNTSTASEVAGSLNEDKHSTTTEPPSLQELQDAALEEAPEEPANDGESMPDGNVTVDNKSQLGEENGTMPGDGGESVKAPSPTCSQEVAAAGATSGGHLDLKFYHSPLW